LNQFFTYSIIHVGFFFQATPIISLAVKPDGLFGGDDIGVPSAKVSPATLTKRSKRVVLWTVLQFILIPLHQGYLEFCSFNN
jgi:hypothetical protein